MKAYQADAGKLMDLIDAAERAVAKLDYEYQLLGTAEGEAWAEADRLRDALDALKIDMQAHLS